MEDAREAWEEVAAEFAIRGAEVTPAMVAGASGSDTLIRDMSLAVQRACLMDGFEAELRRCVSLAMTPVPWIAVYVCLFYVILN
jgi:hypothetical protein